VLPALAVAEALTARGAYVTFAGSPDRIEARLVPDAGYELDAFRISGFPRQPSPALATALLHAAVAPSACRGILRRRRPDVVFGAGGYVSGPMVVASASMRIPVALAEADAHFGLANRLAAPFASRIYLAYPLPGFDARKHRVVGRARSRKARRGRSSSCPPTGRCCSWRERSPAPGR
jgi:UDP-N-acetylglucosamine--N-acetylmuramyl-(pentapeptide) pyrophosphoryl-undecaprenol N-acetylglucosamine transferase